MTNQKKFNLFLRNFDLNYVFYKKVLFAFLIYFITYFLLVNFGLKLNQIISGIFYYFISIIFFLLYIFIDVYKNLKFKNLYILNLGILNLSFSMLIYGVLVNLWKIYFNFDYIYWLIPFIYYVGSLGIVFFGFLKVVNK